jgi:hypothetical protein
MSLANGMLVVLLPLTALAIALVPALRRALPRVLAQPAFVAAAVVLGVAAVGLNAATEAMRLHFRKLPVPLAVPRLDDARLGIPARLGPWVQVSKDEPLDHDVQEVLGTKEFVFRDYVDTRRVSADDVAWFADKPTADRARKLAEIQAREPAAVVRLAVTYYTGLVDTVPHVPERCYVADGFEPAVAPETRAAALGTTRAGGPRQVEYRYLHFQDTTGAGRVDREVAYLFHVNGVYESSHVGVRSRLANLLQRHAYFAKVEVMTTTRARDARGGASGAGGGTNAPAGPAGSPGAGASVAAFEDLLAAVLPEVERCLPDWDAVQRAPAK